MAWLETVELPATERLVLDSQLRQLARAENELVTLDRELRAMAQKESRVRLLMTLPGVDYVVAVGLLAALGDIHPRASKFDGLDNVDLRRQIPALRASFDRDDQVALKWLRELCPFAPCARLDG